MKLDEMICRWMDGGVSGGEGGLLPDLWLATRGTRSFLPSVLSVPSLRVIRQLQLSLSLRHSTASFSPPFVIFYNQRLQRRQLFPLPYCTYHRSLSSSSSLSRSVLCQCQLFVSLSLSPLLVWWSSPAIGLISASLISSGSLLHGSTSTTYEDYSYHYYYY